LITGLLDICEPVVGCVNVKVNPEVVILDEPKLVGALDEIPFFVLLSVP
jgi:hypothetical protein